jgi:erythronate-4-phosphate dehydrogenase
MPTIVADNNISLLNEYFSNLGNVIAKPGREITANDLKNADILLVRSITKVDKNLLHNTKIKFVGSVTSGIDHIDVNYLKNQGIKFVCAKGFNASSVVEYVLSSIALFASKNKVDLSSCTVGIVGVGNIGLRLHYTLYKLGINTILTDPAKPNYNCRLPVLKYIELPELIQKADIISLHCPLITTGKHPTYHLLNKNNFSMIKPGGCIINSCRGSVVDNIGLTDYLDKGNDLNLAFDVWENEPNIYLNLLDKCQIATSHIAGYSYDAKISGSQFIYSKLAEYLAKKHNNKVALNDFWEQFTAVKLTSKQKILDAFSGVSHCYNVKEDTRKLKNIFKGSTVNNKRLFDNLRYQYNSRRQFNIMDFIES